MNKGAHFYHENLCAELINYLKTQYLGRSDVLLDACAPLLQETGVLYSDPYIESSPAYKTMVDGIAKSRLPAYVKSFFNDLIDARLGVYRTPFLHQVEALEATWRGGDIFVSTGTGSGKTECFMWPLSAKLVREAKERPDTWQNQRGVRAIVMYPMNALVSDQISRLRRLFGDSEERFIDAFRDTAGYSARRPQFGMYTGRTPYAGVKPDPKQDKELANSLERILSRDRDDIYFRQLMSSGKIPAKKDLLSFIDKIRQSDHTPSAEDAELVTRFEMQECCPDILITNYSMMEYMLLRPREAKIWQSTREWLERNPTERLTFIIDEAHMYRGSSGGEVALLLRRLFHKLGISRDRVQFILTTASMPHEADEDKEAVYRFAQNLTASDTNCFEYLWGKMEDQKPDGGLEDILVEILQQIDIERLDQDEDARLQELNKFRDLIDMGTNGWTNLQDAYQWLYNNLPRYAPFYTLFNLCRGEAVSISDLASSIFPQASEQDAVLAIDAMLTIAPMAKDASGSVLFPARMHMLFRGFRGVYACSNPDCQNRHHKNGITLGDVKLVDSWLTCQCCGSRVYELYNDRRCGALFFHGYVQECIGRQYLWTNPGAFFESRRMKEIHLYIPMDGESLPKHKTRAQHPFMQCYLDPSSGYITFDDSVSGKVGYRRLWYSSFNLKGNPDVHTFYTCPKCRQQLANARITSFSTRGNQSFYNVVRTQFLQQSPTYFSEADLARFPNQGRKVLLFSDSRQRAAELARDMSQASDEMAVRQLFLLALKKLAETEERIDEDLSLNDVYGYFVQAAMEQNVSLFSGASRDAFEEDKEALRLLADSAKEKGRRVPLPHKSRNFNTAPAEMQEHLLRMFCTRYNTLPDVGLCFLAPAYDQMGAAIMMLKEAGIKVSDEEFLQVFNAILTVFFSDDVALGHQIIDDRRRNVRREFEAFGHKEFGKLPITIANVLGLSDNISAQAAWMNAFRQFCRPGQQNQSRYFLNPEMLHPVYNSNHIWYRCSRCAGISPYLLRECCPICGDTEIREVTDFSPEAFWRTNAELAVNGEQVRVINTEEHTAQLGHKDQRNEMWARTEKYEMQFQDMIEDREKPVDILSSTTTMEVGIDIGSLVAVGLRNMPPMRENYQQRAGRAGRRGASVSTIVTFADGGPHDTHYFKQPAPMFWGKPRRPWIDVGNQKLLSRHLGLIALNDFLTKPGRDRSLDEISALRFFSTYLECFEEYLADFQLSPSQVSILLPNGQEGLTDSFRSNLIDALHELQGKIDAHGDAYGEGQDEKRQKTMLDALYEEGIIPTYSFPKDVVSTYIEDPKGTIVYRPERGLNVAISEYAPGRTIVVDKQTYQIGGIYVHSEKGNLFKPAESYFKDSNFRKELKRCTKCEWFGFTSDMVGDSCPFCASSDIEDMLPMLRPWGFSPVNGDPIPPASVEVKYTSSEKPLYSSLPDDTMDPVKGCVYLRKATRSNQRIIMLNEGSIFEGVRQGFMVCEKCGAAAPGNVPSVLNNIKRPGNRVSQPCKHAHRNVNLGYDFITDMMVLEITLPKNIIEIETPDAILWRTRAATTLAEALRLSTSRILDIEFTDIQAGYRTRYTEENLYLDVYLYDSLSSGAGYSSRIAECLEDLLIEVRATLESCDCQSACYNCIKHYQNQYLQDRLDRHAAKQLLDWCILGALPSSPSPHEIDQYFASIDRLLREDAITFSLDSQQNYVELKHRDIAMCCVIHAAMKKVMEEPQTIYITTEAIKDAKPFAIDIIRKALGLH